MFLTKVSLITQTGGHSYLSPLLVLFPGGEVLGLGLEPLDDELLEELLVRVEVPRSRVQELGVRVRKELLQVGEMALNLFFFSLHPVTRDNLVFRSDMYNDRSGDFSQGFKYRWEYG